jgi:chromosome segregation ATPase
MHAAKLQSELADNQQQISKLKRSIQTLESSKELLERKGYDLGNQLDEVRRELSESSYKLERLQF